jgi:hypothetical protein
MRAGKELTDNYGSSITPVLHDATAVFTNAHARVTAALVCAFAALVQLRSRRKTALRVLDGRSWRERPCGAAVRWSSRGL